MIQAEADMLGGNSARNENRRPFSGVIRPFVRIEHTESVNLEFDLHINGLAFSVLLRM